MKAVVYRRYGGPEVMELADMPEPGLGVRDVRVAVRAAGLNPVDWKVRSGHLKRAMRLRFPVIAGFDVSGVVTEVGMRARHFKVGDRVYAYVQRGRMGTLAEQVTVERTDVAPMPKSLSFEEAAAVPLAALTAWQCLVDAMKVEPEQRILIHAGAGGVGTFAIQFAKYLGADVATTASEPKHALLRELGADECIDYHAEDFEARGRQYDAVFDTIGGSTLYTSFKVVKPGGTVVSIVSLPDETTARRMGMNSIVRWMLRYLNRKVNAAAGAADARFRAMFVQPSEAQLRRIAALMDEGWVKPVIDSVYPLEAFKDAFAKLETGHATGKIVVRVSEEAADT